MKFTTIVVENEQKMREVLIQLLNQCCPEIQVIGEASNIDDAYGLIVKAKPQVVFLDIEMPGGNGFELLNKFDSPPFETIFVTSYGHYSIRALRLSALDYILKPVSTDDLKTLPQRINEAIELKENALKYKMLQENLSNPPQEKKIIISTKSKFETIIVKDIAYLKADDNYTQIYLINGRKITVSKILREYEEMLCEPDGAFVRIHKAHIVNASYISSVERGNTCYAVLNDNTRLEIARRKKGEISKLLNVHL